MSAERSEVEGELDQTYSRQLRRASRLMDAAEYIQRKYHIDIGLEFEVTNNEGDFVAKLSMSISGLAKRLPFDAMRKNLLLEVSTLPNLIATDNADAAYLRSRLDSINAQIAALQQKERALWRQQIQQWQDQQQQQQPKWH